MDNTKTPLAAMELPLKIDSIKELLPHRYPFLLIDRVLEVEPAKRLVALKNVTINEPFFQGHFPEYPIMPGVLVIEAMAQAGGVLAGLGQDTSAKQLILLTGVDGAKFRRPVLPGDQLRIEVTVLQKRSRAMRLEGKAFVDGVMVCEAVLSCGMVPRPAADPGAGAAAPTKGTAEDAPVPAELVAVTTE